MVAVPGTKDRRLQKVVATRQINALHGRWPFEERGQSATVKHWVRERDRRRDIGFMHLASQRSWACERK